MNTWRTAVKSNEGEGRMADLRARIARSLRREREAHGISVSELARRAGVSKATVSQLRADRAIPAWRRCGPSATRSACRSRRSWRSSRVRHG
ncbi:MULTISPECIES: helix-turn-helix domain-containing protein [Microbacterium]|uniref:helix-turn-helix domain-containing protein n=1 Tax=Microbacterium TaxID=33882 RepID=UPI00300E1757